jgi:phosphoribosylaminoimidazolecarboxamide formyltransferase/IMP cyclohydrolase
VRALLSVYDKTGVVELAQALHDSGIDLVASGGTAKAISGANIPVTDVADFTGYPAMLSHRVVTLHPKVHGGLLADRRDTEHLRDLETHQIDLIDIVVGNLYPFSSDPSIELIDIGGPTMVRAAAKNHEYVTVLVDPADYNEVLQEIKEHGGHTTPETRKRLARKAFAHTAAYENAIVTWFDADGTETLPASMHITLEQREVLRYGENPHQEGARYNRAGEQSWWDNVTQHSGMALSYLNIFDGDAAWSMVHAMGDEPAVAIIKHANPCGFAVADNLAVAYQNAFDCDPRSAFGGIVALNRNVDNETADRIVEAAQADMIIAPGFDEGVVERLQGKRKNTRVLEANPPTFGRLTVRQLSDSFLVQENYRFGVTPAEWRVVTERQPTPEELVDGALAWKLASFTTSNAIVLVKDGAAWGIGAGQQNRVESAQIAAQKASGRVIGGACASDAFYPFPDGVEAAADAGVALVVQPGGSVGDEAVIAAANARGIAMVFTGERQFRH